MIGLTSVLKDSINKHAPLKKNIIQANENKAQALVNTWYNHFY